MSDSLNTVDKVFSHVESWSDKPRAALPKKKNLKKQELELALTVLLVDLASCDQHFDPQEYQIILIGLRRMFGTTRDQVQALVNQATLVLNNLRGTSRFANLLKENLNENERLVIMEIVEEMIGADGVEDGFEIYLRHKISDILGIKAPGKAKQAQ